MVRIIDMSELKYWRGRVMDWNTGRKIDWDMGRKEGRRRREQEEM